VPGARAGTALLLDGNRAFVGAPAASAVLVLERDAAGTWAHRTTLTPPGDGRGTQFGFALAAPAGELWVGAPGVDGSDGRVFRFTADASGDGSTWQMAAPLDPDPSVGASWPKGFGYAVAVAGERGVVGMPTRDFGEGRAVALARTTDGWTPGQ